MAELRSVDPRTLAPNPTNPRRTPTPKAQDDQLLASIQAIGIIQPPLVKNIDGTLTIIAGNRRTAMAIAAKLDMIDVVVCEATDSEAAMQSLSENLVRASMNGVDLWHAIEALEAQGWNEQAVADALALPLRKVKQLKLLAHLHPAMLDFMAQGSMPNDEQLRTIAAAPREQQAQVWKKHKPKKGHDVAWYEIARALTKRRIPFAVAKFDADYAAAYGVVWEDDLFAPADIDGRFTSNVEGFFGAQHQWMQDHLPERGTLVPTNEWGQPQLPKKAEEVYGGKPAKNDVIGHYLDSRSGEAKTVIYRLPAPKAAAKPMAGGNETAANPAGDDATAARVRPDVTQKGMSIIGALRTGALHEALGEAEMDDTTLLALLVIAFAGMNVTVTSHPVDHSGRESLASTLTEGNVLTHDPDLVRTAARGMLEAVMSCNDNMTDSGPFARIAGDAIGASLRLPTMATEEFLSCLSKQALERAAKAEGVRVEQRGKDTRARLIEHFKSGTYVYPAALFKLTDAEAASIQAYTARRTSWVQPHTGDAIANFPAPEGHDSNEDEGMQVNDGADGEDFETPPADTNDAVGKIADAAD